ncbi:putative Alpha/beta hydrolase, putative protoporphyrin IX magnesium chelatase bchO-like [Bradyrhizobium sp. ORS 278]|uniref:alpha/beta fold hydrolase BchO n=1 Tax=Bradyrhizobium sp. (strain ORS 278) TaxID=114615 RepID=UPI0001507DC0|nr:alpha/beta fold hydrolase BchO [Bradyrhizobium sp. ORS 278]CAL75488.1 putative Alpha/beta hydrolase, putative protoporphyrin IX magnesium chelatase bchO-like [Bradyrhizobium sp. ORS 278]
MSDKPSWSIDGRTWPNRDASRFVDAGGIRWHVQVMGQGPVALLAHGTGAATHSWRDLAPLLARRFTIVAPDLSGHGFTSTPNWQRLSLPGMSRDLATLCEQLAIAPEIAIGHSAGAAILTRMALDGLIAPKLIVSLNGAYLPFGGAAAQFLSPLAKMMALNPLVPRLFAWRGRDPAAVHRLLKATGSTLDANGERLYGRLVGSPGHVGAALEMMANWDLNPLVRDLPKLTTALLLIAATRDHAITPDVARRVRQLVPQAQLELIDGLGHLAHEEKPARIAELIVAAAERARVLAAQQEMSN